MKILKKQDITYVTLVSQPQMGKSSLYGSYIEEGCDLTELENNLIAQNINFQYIFSLKKSRWAATKKQMISVPVTQESVINTVKQLPRMPRDGGLIGVNLKRKMAYSNNHKKEYVAQRK